VRKEAVVIMATASVLLRNFMIKMCDRVRDKIGMRFFTDELVVGKSEITRSENERND
jgi:hypothetical protein